MTVDLIAEYDSADALVAAVRLVRTTRVRVLETYTPVPIEALEPPSGHLPLAPVAAGAGLAGVAAGYVGQWLVAAYLYPLDLGARPPHLPLAFVPIALETGFLCAALAVVIGFVRQARLTALWEPVCDVPGFRSATLDGYWLAIRGDDPDAMRAVLERTGARSIAQIGRAP
jgi:hypothetical protein